MNTICHWKFDVFQRIGGRTPLLQLPASNPFFILSPTVELQRTRVIISTACDRQPWPGACFGSMTETPGLRMAVLCTSLAQLRPLLSLLEKHLFAIRSAELAKQYGQVKTGSALSLRLQL